jgi:hypothetical protein
MARRASVLISSVFRLREADRPLISKDGLTLVHINHAKVRDGSASASEASGPTNNVDNVVASSCCKHAGDPGWASSRVGIPQKYRITGLSYPMVVNLDYDRSIVRSPCDAEDVNAYTAPDIASGGAKSCGYEVLFINGALFIEKVGQDCPTNILTILFAALCK